MGHLEHLEINYALVIDSDLQLVRMPGNPGLPYPVRPPLLARTPAEAVRLIQDPQMHFGAICINPLLSSPGAIGLIRLSLEHRPGVPIFILQNVLSEDSDRPTPSKAAREGEVEDKPPLAGYELWRLALQGIIKKGPNNPYILSPVQPLALVPPPIEPSPPEAPPAERLKNEYFSVPIQNFYFHSKVFFDVFIRISDHHYLKILEAGDSFVAERIEKYLAKNVRHLYFKSANYQRCLDYCTSLERTFMQSSELTNAVKISQTLIQAREPINAMRLGQKPTELQVEAVLDFNESIQLLIKNLDLRKKSEINEIYQNLKAYEHSVGTCFVSGLLANALGISGQQELEDLGLAAFFHDIGLYRMSPAVQTEDPKRMNPEERKNYHEHPLLSVEILQGLIGISPSVLSTIAMHHERHGGAGFPHQLPAGKISLAAEIVGISDEFVRLIHALPDFSSQDLLAWMSTSMTIGFSAKTVQALFAIFDPVEKTADPEKAPS